MIQFIRDMRIRHKLFLAYSCAFFLIFALAGSFVYHQVRAIIRASIESELTKSTETIMSMVRTAADVSIKNYMRAAVEKNYEMIRHLHRQELRGTLTREEARKRAAQLIDSQTIGKTGYIYCIDGNGIMQVCPKRSLVGVDMSGLWFIREQMARRNGYMEFDWKEPLADEGRHRAQYMMYFEPWDWIITASSFRDEFNEIVNVADFKERMLSLGFGKSGYPFILSHDGFLLIHPHLEGKHYSTYGDPLLSDVAKRIIDERNGSFSYMWRNPGEKEFRRKVVFFTDIPELGWIVASSSYYDEFYGPLDAIRAVILTSLIVALLLIIPVSMWIGSIITRPLKVLQTDFGKGAKGDFSGRMRVRSRDELGMLASYFNSFMEQLSEYSDSLREEIAVRRQAEEKLIAQDKAKSLFLSSASHELRTPLTSIFGFLRLMKQNFDRHFKPYLVNVEGLRPRVERFSDNLAVVESEAERLGRLVNDLLDLSKIESGRMDWVRDDLDIADVLRKAAAAVAPFSEEKPEVKLVVAPVAPGLSVTADGDRIHQVLINLMNNAFKYTKRGSVTLSAEARDGAIVFSVCDTGSGIPESDLEKVFDIFYQVRDENMRSLQFGTGLGLAICQHIVSHYGGKISVTSTVGVGSCFIFTLPQDENAA